MEISKDLINSCIAGDRRAQNELYKQTFGFLMNICRRYKNNYDDAGASLNGIFLKTLEALVDFDQSKPLWPWLKTIAIRHLVDDYRKEVRWMKMGSISDGEMEQFPSGLSPQIKLAAQDILKWIQHLEEPTRSVFNLYAIDGFKHAEIADLLTITEGNSRWHLNKARKQLKKRFEVEQQRLHRITMDA